MCACVCACVRNDDADDDDGVGVGLDGMFLTPPSSPSPLVNLESSMWISTAPLFDTTLRFLQCL